MRKKIYYGMLFLNYYWLNFSMPNDEKPLDCKTFKSMKDYIDYMYYEYCKEDQIKYKAIILFMLTEMKKNEDYFLKILEKS